MNIFIKNTPHGEICNIIYMKHVSHDFKHTNKNVVTIWKAHDMNINS